MDGPYNSTLILHGLKIVGGGAGIYSLDRQLRISNRCGYGSLVFQFCPQNFLKMDD